MQGAWEKNPFALAIAGANDGLWDWDSKTDRVLRSPRVQEILGAKPVILVSHSQAWVELIHPHDRKRYLDMVRQTFKGSDDHFSCEYRVRHANGGYRWLLDRGIACRDGGGRVVRMAGSVTDITERKRAEVALRESEQRFRDYAESASDWYWETDTEHRIPQAFVRTPSRPLRAGEWVGKRRWEVALDRDSEPEKWRDHMATLERREPFRDLVYQVRRADGSIRYFSVSGKPVYDSDGAFAGYRGSGRDVTVAMVAAEGLRRAKAEAESASAAKSLFLANMSHELRTPLNAILGFSEVIAEEMLGAVGNARYREYAADIHHSGHHLLRLINDVLDMSKIEAGKLLLREDRIDIAHAIDSCLPLVRHRADEARVTIRTRVPSDLPLLIADETRLQQIVINLLTNAIKFTRRDGLVTVGAACRAADGLAITVRDTGIGMSPDDVAQALVPFQQIENSVNRQGEGTGLGLPLAKRLIELHGGRMDIESAPERGTTIIARFPPERVLPRR